MLGFDARAARYTWTAAMVLLLLWLVYLMRGTLFVFIVALLFAYLLSPLVNVIDRFLPGKRTRTPALAIAYVIFIAVLFVVATQIGSRVADEANSLAKSTPALIARLQQPTPAVPANGQLRQRSNPAKDTGADQQKFRRHHLFSSQRRRQDSKRGRQSDLRGDHSHSGLLLPEGRRHHAPVFSRISSRIGPGARR